MWGFLFPTLPSCVGLPAEPLMWCDVLCEFRDRERWKWFAGKSTRASEMKDVRFSVSLGGRGLLKLRKWEWQWLITRQQSRNTCKAHGGPLLIFWGMNSWNDWSFCATNPAASLPSELLQNVKLFAPFINSFLYVYQYFSWVSVLQNSKEEALNTALGGDQLHLQDSGLQELSRAIIAELRQMPGNEACADCGAPGQPVVVDGHCRLKCGNTSGNETIMFSNRFHLFYDCDIIHNQKHSSTPVTLLFLETVQWLFLLCVSQIQHGCRPIWAFWPV